MPKREATDKPLPPKKQKSEPKYESESDSEDEEDDDVEEKKDEDRSDEGPLFEAVGKCDLDAIKKLVSEGEKEDWEDLIYWACQKGNIDVYKYIRTKLDSTLKLSDIIWMINICCEFGHLELIKLILQEKGAMLIDPNDCDPTPGLGGACERGQLHIVEYMLKDKEVVKMINDQKKEGGTTTFFTDLANKGKKWYPKGKQSEVIKMLHADKRLKYH